MKLLQIGYSKNNKRKYLLLLYLGKRGGRVCGVQSDKIPDNEKESIIKHIQTISSMPIAQKIQWVKKHCPESYRNGYCEINNNNIYSIDEYQIK